MPNIKIDFIVVFFPWFKMVTLCLTLVCFLCTGLFLLLWLTTIIRESLYALNSIYLRPSTTSPLSGGPVWDATGELPPRPALSTSDLTRYATTSVISSYGKGIDFKYWQDTPNRPELFKDTITPSGARGWRCQVPPRPRSFGRNIRSVASACH